MRVICKTHLWLAVFIFTHWVFLTESFQQVLALHLESLRRVEVFDGRERDDLAGVVQVHGELVLNM